MFVRAKRVKSGLYAYKVKNTWTAKGARQRVVGYLGKVIVLAQQEEVPFSDFIGEPLEAYLTKRTPRKAMVDLIGWVLKNHGFSRVDKHWSKGDIIVNPYAGKVTDGARSAVLKIGPDYMCSLTLRRLFRFSSEKEEQEVATELASAFVQAGIAVPQEVFIDLFQKMHKGGKTYAY